MSDTIQQQITPSRMENNAETPPKPPDSDSQNRKMHSTHTIISGPNDLFHQISRGEIEDLVESFNPDSIFLTGNDHSTQSVGRIKNRLPDSIAVLHPGSAKANSAYHIPLNEIDLISCPSFDSLSEIKSLEQSGEVDTDTETIVASNLLEISLKMDDLEADLEGLERYKDAFNSDQLEGTYTHLLGSIRAGYRRNWNGVSVRGGGLPNGQQRKQFTSLQITEGGFVTTKSIKRSKLGLKAIQGVGETTAERLKSDGYCDPSDIATSPISDLQSVEGIGKKKASNISNRAKALNENKVIATSNKSVPGSNPIFIDIETDGLNPTRVWLIGVKDSLNGNYMSFMAADPDEKGKAVEGFMMWFAANARNRTLQAWNGWNFDYPVLREHIQQHAPNYLKEWEHASKRDPLRWARDLDNAILPARTNKLEDVAEALGWESENTGLSGAEVARRFRAWIENPTPETELEWERHKRYCRDDVEALEHVYKAMAQADRSLSPDGGSHERIPKETTQGSLSDSY